MTVLGRSLYSFGKPPSGVTTFFQGALGGGGFANNLSASPDGSIRFVTGNTPNLYRWRSSTGLWDNQSTSPTMDNLGIKPLKGPGTCDFVAVGPDNLRVYLTCALIGADQRVGYINTGGGKQGLDHGQLYRSDDGGNSWSRPGTNVGSTGISIPLDYGSGGLTPFGGPRMVVDPNNKDVVWGMMYNGIVWVSYNGGVTIHIVQALADLTLLKCQATANCVLGLKTITVDSNPVAASFDYAHYGVYNMDHPFSLGGSSFGGGDMYLGGDATHVTVGNVQANNPVGIGSFGDPAVVSGDHLYFGLNGCLMIDGSNGTVTNPGIALGDPGATGSASKYVYFCWMAGGGGNVWSTQNAGGTLSSGDFAVVTGSPTLDQGANTYKKMKLSFDNSIVGGGNVLYLVDNMNNHDAYWRYVGASAPTSSGLSINTWTQFTSQMGSGLSIVAPNPKTAGAFTIVNQQNGYRQITGYGASPGTLNLASQSFSGDTPWLNTGVDIVLSDANFDPNVTDKIWQCDGVGVYWFIQNNTNSPTVINQNMQQMESYIVTSILKAPSPGNLLLCGQDRPQVTITDPHTVPPRYFPNTSTFVGNGYYCEYARDNPSVVYFSKGTIYRNTSAGVGGSSNVNWSAGLTSTRVLYRGVAETLGLGGGGSGYVAGSYTNVPLTGGTGTGATGDFVVSGGGSVSSVTVNNKGSLYTNGDILGASAANLGGSGSGFFCGANVNGAIQTVSGSPTVTISSPAHGFATNDPVGFPTFTGYPTVNNINLANLRLLITKIDNDHYTVTAPTNANATGSGGGHTTTTGIIEGARGWSCNGPANMAALTSTQLFVVGDSGAGGPWFIQYGTSPDAGVTWNWAQTQYSSAPLLGGGGDPFFFGNSKPVDIVDGVIWYVDGVATINSVANPLYKTLFKSTDGGATLTVPGTVGNIPATQGFGHGFGPRAITGNAGHVLVCSGTSGLNLGLLRTRDSGVTWETMANCQVSYLCCVGPNVVSGRPYPSVYVLGLCNGVSIEDPNIFRCDDMSPSSTACTWTAVTGLEKANCDGIQDMCCDPDIPGKIYLATYDTGYVVGVM